MHNKGKDLACWALTKAEACGYDNLSSQDWDDLKDCMEVAKAVVCIDKDYRIVEAMDESSKEESMKYIQMYEPGMPQKYYNKPMYYYDDNIHGMHNYERDMDRMNNRMYYSSTSGSSGYGGDGGRGYPVPEGGRTEKMRSDENYQHDPREGRSYMSRRGYMEAKETGADADKKHKELEKYMEELGNDIIEMINGMDPQEKQILKSKMVTLANKV